MFLIYSLSEHSSTAQDKPGAVPSTVQGADI